MVKSSGCHEVLMVGKCWCSALYYRAHSATVPSLCLLSPSSQLLLDSESRLPLLVLLLQRLTFFYFTFRFLFLCLSHHAFSNGLTLGTDESLQSKASLCFSCKGSEKWDLHSRHMPHNLDKMKSRERDQERFHLVSIVTV